MATHSSILAWRIPWTEEPGGAIVHGVTRVRHDIATKPPPPILKTALEGTYLFYKCRLLGLERLGN